MAERRKDFLDFLGEGVTGAIDQSRNIDQNQADLIMKLRLMNQQQGIAAQGEQTDRMRIRQEGEKALAERTRNEALDKSLIELRASQKEAADALAMSRRNKAATKGKGVTRKEFMMESNRLFNVLMTEEQKKFTATQANPNDPANLFGGASTKPAPVPQQRILELQAQARRETIKTLLPDEWARQQAEAAAIKARVQASVPGATPAPASATGQATFNRAANPIFEGVSEAEESDSTFETPFGPMTRQQMFEALQAAGFQDTNPDDPELQQDFEFVFGPAE